MKEMLVDMIKEMIGTPRSGAEIGVFRGDTSEHLLNSFPDADLYFVDTWKEWKPGDSYYDLHLRSGRLSQEQWNEIEAEARQRIGDRSAGILKTTSLRASTIFPNKSLDFVFIDADHNYANVLSDILCWRPRCYKLMCGHDYGGPYAGVSAAVDEVFGKENVYNPGGRLWAVKLNWEGAGNDPV